MDNKRKWVLMIAVAAVAAGLILAAVGAFLAGIPLLSFREGRSVTEEHVTQAGDGEERRREEDREENREEDRKTGENAAQAGTGLTEQTLTFDAGCREIAADLKAVDLTVRAADREDIQVRWWEAEGDEYQVWEDGGVLRAEYASDAQWYEHIWFDIGGGARRYQMEIEVPRDYEGVLSLETTSGEISVRGLSFGADSGVSATSGDIKLTDCGFAGDLTAAATSGELELEGLSGDGSLSIAATSGDVELNNVTVGGDILVSRTSGELSAENVACGGTLEAGGTSGDNELEQVSAGALRVTGSSGAVEGKGLDIRQAVEIETTSGDVSLTLSGDMEDYDITADTSSGDNNLPTRGEYGDRVLRISTTSGGIRVKFSGN